MKKIFSIALICALALLGFSACGEDPPPAPTKFVVALPTSSEYSVTSDKLSAEEGETVTLTVTVIDPNKELESVLANEIACQKDGDAYSFVMPAQDVTIVVNLKDYEEVTSQDGVSFHSSVPGQIAKAQPADTYARQVFYFEFENTIINAEATVSSTNQSVIPDSAITCSVLGDGSYKTGGSITIDLTQVELGVTYLGLNIKASTVGRTDVTLVKKIEVVDFGEVELETWQASVTFDMSDVIGTADTLYVQVSDYDHVYGTPRDMVTYVKTVTTEESVTVEFDYYVGHRYSLTAFYYLDPNDSTSFVTFDIPEAYGEGSSVSGFAKYVNNFLTFESDGGSITVDVLEKQNSISQDVPKIEEGMETGDGESEASLDESLEDLEEEPEAPDTSKEEEGAVEENEAESSAPEEEETPQETKTYELNFENLKNVALSEGNLICELESKFLSVSFDAVLLVDGLETQTNLVLKDCSGEGVLSTNCAFNNISLFLAERGTVELTLTDGLRDYNFSITVL